jgi:hypothetical protein
MSKPEPLPLDPHWSYFKAEKLCPGIVIKLCRSTFPLLSAVFHLLTRRFQARRFVGGFEGVHGVGEELPEFGFVAAFRNGVVDGM